jgi:hypothetical protein
LRTIEGRYQDAVPRSSRPARREAARSTRLRGDLDVSRT